ncbi:hypothetical protein [Actinoplanes sp. NPDC049265]|uniref:hypothetical protein n=1 Tax=Actinoplanes sp. NPDC049265 TaxID=3363902 RepID=UPI00370FBFF9
MNAIAAVALAVFLFVNGAAHFVRPGYVRSLVPAWLGHARLLVAAGGAGLFAVGGLLLIPPARAFAAWCAAAMIAVFLVAHVDAFPRKRRPVGVLNIVLNVAYIAWAVMVAMTS